MFLSIYNVRLLVFRVLQSSVATLPSAAVNTPPHVPPMPVTQPTRACPRVRVTPALLPFFERTDKCYRLGEMGPDNTVTGARSFFFFEFDLS